VGIRIIRRLPKGGFGAFTGAMVSRNSEEIAESRFPNKPTQSLNKNMKTKPNNSCFQRTQSLAFLLAASIGISGELKADLLVHYTGVVDPIFSDFSDSSGKDNDGEAIGASQGVDLVKIGSTAMAIGGGVNSIPVDNAESDDFNRIYTEFTLSMWLRPDAVDDEARGGGHGSLGKWEAAAIEVGRLVAETMLAAPILISVRSTSPISTVPVALRKASLLHPRFQLTNGLTTP